MFSFPSAKPALEVTPERLLGKNAQSKNQQESGTATNDSTAPAPPLKSRGIVLPCSVFRFTPVDLPTLLQDDPVFDTKSAAAFLGVSEERMKKWRQRGEGPAYVQYEQCGTVRYALKDLLKFRAEHTITPGKKRRSR